MAKAKAKKPTEEVPKAAEQQQPTAKVLEPAEVHALFGLPGPYEPPPAPIPTKGYTTFWDAGMSIQTLVKKQPKLLYLRDFSERFAKDSDSWKWRQIRLTPIEPNLTFAEQEKKLITGDKPAAARELVTFLILHYLTTGERCSDTMESGSRVIVGPFHELGLDIAHVSDEWKSPSICLSAVCTPVPRRK